MNKLQEVALQLKQAANEILGEILNVDKQIDSLLEKRDLITSAHVSKEDYLSYLRYHFKTKADQYGISLLKLIEQRSGFDFGRLENNLKNKSGFLGVDFLTLQNLPTVITENALYFYFSEQMVERIGDALDGKEWPDDAISVVDRREALLSIEADLVVLNKKRDDLVKALDDAGFTSA